MHTKKWEISKYCLGERKSPEIQNRKHWPSNTAGSVFDREYERIVLISAGIQSMPHKEMKKLEDTAGIPFHRIMQALLLPALYV